jgi:hypothetical protein
MDEKIVTLHDFSSDFFGATLKRRENNFGNNNKSIKSFLISKALLIVEKTKS